MKPRKKSFVKPIYEISLESQNKVYIREEDKGPLRRLWDGFIKFVLIPVISLLFITCFLQIAQNLFSPPELLISVRHVATGETASPAELQLVNVYLDESRHPLPKKITQDGIIVKFRKSGVHLLGIENLGSPVDSALFFKEKSVIRNIHLIKALRRDNQKGERQSFAFHRIINSRDFIQAKFLFYRIPAPQKPHLFFSAFHATPQLILLAPEINAADDLAIFSSRVLHSLAGVTPQARVLEAGDLEKLKEEFNLDLPEFTPWFWASDRLKNKRYTFAHHMAMTTRSTIFLLPRVYKQNNSTFADFVLAFAPLGGVEFQPIQVRRCNAGVSKEQFLDIASNISLIDIIEKYLLIYEEFLISGIVPDNLVRQFVDLCNSLSPQVDALIYYDNLVVRSSNGRPAEPAAINLEGILSDIEPLNCMPLYDRLMQFWTRDAAEIKNEALTLRNREILRAIFRRSLALKAEKHMCSEKNWPTESQQLMLFRAMQDNISQRWTWEWLKKEPWLDMVKSEIDSLTNK